MGTDKNGHSMSSPKKQCLEQFPMPKIQNSAGGEISKGGQQDEFLLAAKIRLRKRKACDTLEQSVLFLLTRNLPDIPFFLPRAALQDPGLWASSQGLSDEGSAHVKWRSKQRTQSLLRYTHIHETTEDTPKVDKRGVWCQLWECLQSVVAIVYFLLWKDSLIFKKGKNHKFISLSSIPSREKMKKKDPPKGSFQTQEYNVRNNHWFYQGWILPDQLD